MKKRPMMKMMLVIVILLPALISCKTRHVSTTKTEIASNEVLTNTIKRDSVKIDTSKVRTQTTTINNVHDTAVLIITPDSGTVQTISLIPGKLFAYSGRAKSIVYHGALHDNSTVNKAMQVNKAEMTKVSLDDSLRDEKQVTEQIKSKTSDAKADHSWVIALVGLLVILGLCGYLLHRFGIA